MGNIGQVTLDYLGTLFEQMSLVIWCSGVLLPRARAVRLSLWCLKEAHFKDVSIKFD